MRADYPRTGIVLLVLLLLGCGSDGGPSSPLVIAKAAANSGDGQEGIVSTVLPNPLQVRVTRDGNPAADATVTWATSNPGASVVAASATTDANGMASATFTLGSADGPQSATASVSGGSSVTFDAVATLPPAPATATVTVGNNFFGSDRNGTQNAAVDTVAVGGTVTWTWVNTDPTAHSVHSLGVPTFAGSALAADNGFVFAFTFTTPGTYQYDCGPHPFMTGRVVVR